MVAPDPEKNERGSWGMRIDSLVEQEGVDEPEALFCAYPRQEQEVALAVILRACSSYTLTGTAAANIIWRNFRLTIAILRDHAVP
jgi:hypothetical protein